MKNYKYTIHNLECPVCAKKIENKINESKKFSNCVIDFNAKTLIFNSEYEFKAKEIDKLIKSIEKEAYITFEE